MVPKSFKLDQCEQSYDNNKLLIKPEPILANFVPIDRAREGLLIGNKFVKHGSMLTKLCSK